jgi:hypothetical protein
MHVSEIKVAEPFKGLFRIDDTILTAIQENMKEKGYDPNRPIDIWQHRNIVVDGHTRLQAAQNLGLKEIPVVERFFADEEAALKYAIRNQKDRRNLNDGDILNLVEKIDKLFPMGGDRKSNFRKQKIDPAQDTNGEKMVRDSRRITAETIGISLHNVSQCRYILNHCINVEAIKEQINNGKSIHEVCQDSINARQEAEKRDKKKKEALDKKQDRHWWHDDMTDEMSTEGYSCPMSFAFIAKHRSLPKTFDSLNEHAPEMQKIKEVIEHFAASGEAGKATFKIFCEREPVQRFLGSLLVNDFITILKSFGYKIENPPD